ncbi:MAG TPA: hypothetical protein VHM25_04215 [Polyangiaceae bacterium]|jgi:hypothetical protein|nr:hypothetical protein [Polyangiaceae bacterium]
MQDVLEPPITQNGVAELRLALLSVNAFMKKNERKNLAAALNGLLAAPSFASWRQGTTLDVGEWLTRSPDQPGKTPIVIVSVAHLDDEERALVLGVLLEECSPGSAPCPAPNACTRCSCSMRCTASCRPTPPIPPPSAPW